MLVSDRVRVVWTDIVAPSVTSGMSTVPEVLAAVHADIKVLAISLVTNICLEEYDTRSGDLLDEIMEIVNRRRVSFQELLTKTIQRLQEFDQN